MKKILYLFLTVTFIFSSCKKEDDDVVIPTVISGCTDSEATNYNANATNDYGLCAYDIIGVWETTSAKPEGQEVLAGTWVLELHYIFADGDMGVELYDLNGDIAA